MFLRLGLADGGDGSRLNRRCLRLLRRARHGFVDDGDAAGRDRVFFQDGLAQFDRGRSVWGEPDGDVGLRRSRRGRGGMSRPGAGKPRHNNQ